MERDGLIHAFVLDGKGGGHKLTWEEVNSWTPGDGTLWLHLNYTSTEASTWLYEKSGLDSLIVGALLNEETRPRSTVIGNGVLLTLRGINRNPGADFEDMVSLRIWAEEHRVITTRKRQLLSVADLNAQLVKGCGPTSASHLIFQITHLLSSYIEEAVEQVEEKISHLEDQVASSHSATMRTEISVIRRDAIILRRYLAPQRDAISKMQVDNVPWFTAQNNRRVHELTNSLIRIVEDLDSLRDRAGVAREELTNALSAQLNSRMYVLSIITAVFLPLSFFTGLLGINVGGIPGATYKWAFIIVILLLVCICTGQIFYFRKRGWI